MYVCMYVCMLVKLKRNYLCGLKEKVDFIKINKKLERFKSVKEMLESYFLTFLEFCTGYVESA